MSTHLPVTALLLVLLLSFIGTTCRLIFRMKLVLLTFFCVAHCIAVCSVRITITSFFL